MADVAPRTFFHIRNGETYDGFFDRCLLFLEKLFLTVTDEIGKLPNAKGTLPQRWRNYLLKDGNRERIYTEVVKTTNVSW